MPGQKTALERHGTVTDTSALHFRLARDLRGAAGAEVEQVASHTDVLPGFYEGGFKGVFN